jgi:hypothetical protein
VTAIALYARAAPIYRNHGWTSALPLPEHAKFPPPEGYTGAAGVDPDDQQIAQWCEKAPDGNIALRLPDGIIGIDIDAYADKHGDASLLALEAVLGALPATWKSTSRPLGVSGIRLYRVPPGRYNDKPAPSIEIIQHHHRYVVVMPSVHPEGRPYVWFDEDNAEQHRPPRPEDLAELPDTWLEQLRERPRTDAAYEPRPHQVDDWTPAVTRAFTKALMDMPGGRHDAAMVATMALCRLHSLEHPGARQAIDELGVRFRAAIGDRSTPAQAEREWNDLIAGAVRHVDTVPSTAPKWEPWTPRPDMHDWWTTDEPREGSQAPTDGLTGRITFDHDFWTRNREGEQWLIEPVLALGRSHALYAPAKAGKSLLALEIAAAIASGRPVLDQPAGEPRIVLYADFEMTEDDIYERLNDLGYGEGDDLTRFHYHLHPLLPPLDTPHGGIALVSHAEQIGAELVVVDTVARTISGEENSSDTINALARHTFSPLKARHITSLRVDHAGKDLTKGQRGTSAKNDDVDVVWQLTVADEGAVTLRATHRRISWVPEVVNLTRRDDPLRHQPTDQVWPVGTAEAARKLDDANAPVGISTREARTLIGGKQHVVVAAVKLRKMRVLMPGSAAGSAKSDELGSAEGSRS